jgi:uncharacterized protein
VIDTAKYGPWALIAGGSEGVGAEFALLLAEAGLNLVLVARTADALEQIAEGCRQHGGEIRTVQADLSDPGYLTGNTLFVDGGSHINGVAWAPDLDA